LSAKSDEVGDAYRVKSTGNVTIVIESNKNAEETKAVKENTKE